MEITPTSSSALSLSQPPYPSHPSGFPVNQASSTVSNNPFSRGFFTDSEPTSAHRPSTQRIQPAMVPADPVFNQWSGPTLNAGVSSFPSTSQATSTVNQRRMAAAERHQPLPRGLPAPTRTRHIAGLPTVFNGPRGNARRNQAMAPAVPLVQRPTNTIKDYFFAVIISPRSVSFLDVLIFPSILLIIN